MDCPVFGFDVRQKRYLTKNYFNLLADGNKLGICCFVVVAYD
jgi:hypothetical protein